MTTRYSLLSFATPEDLAYESRVEELTKEPDWEAILVKLERADLIDLIAELHADRHARDKLVSMVEEWAMDRAAEDLANDLSPDNA